MIWYHIRAQSGRNNPEMTILQRYQYGRTPFTREGSQVQSLSRPPRKACYFSMLYQPRRFRHHTERYMNAHLRSGRIPGEVVRGLFHV